MAPSCNSAPIGVACAPCQWPAVRGAERDQHVEHFAGVVLAAAHAHQVAIRPEIARPHLRARLEAAAAADDGAAEEVVFALRREHAHALDMMLVAVEAVTLDS